MSHPKKTTKTKIDWSEILWPLILFVVSLILTTIFLIASQQYHKHINEWTQTQKSHFGSLEKEYTQLQDTLEIVNKLYVQKVEQLIKIGFFYHEQDLSLEKQRLKMFGKIRTLLSQLPLFTANYTLSETKRYTVPDFLRLEKSLKTYQTQLTLKVEILHEEDLLKLIEAIKFAGIFNLQRCDIERLTPQIDVKNISQAYFKATCVLARYTSSIEN
ncbi:hypothetical protein PN36_10190 [Candidatus Thiomargarita nelsonii]|uniref:Uncharacterized protein n=1 Tax=Candidatus Thiomargarita nelsonii TaxID=1003181 RepID=A0A0A6PCN6_9GAMM|nr:hypothetical protein PN36_10190 [Candidatus Thiomargarita nelsonii]